MENINGEYQNYYAYVHIQIQMHYVASFVVVSGHLVQDQILEMSFGFGH